MKKKRHKNWKKDTRIERWTEWTNLVDWKKYEKKKATGWNWEIKQKTMKEKDFENDKKCHTVLAKQSIK